MSVHIPINILVLLSWSPGLIRPKLKIPLIVWLCQNMWLMGSQFPSQGLNPGHKKQQPLGNPRAAPTCSPPCGHSAGSSPLRGSGSRQSGRGPRTPDNSRGTCGRGSAGGRRSCTGWAAASGTPGRSRKEHGESSSGGSHRPGALNQGRLAFLGC